MELLEGQTLADRLEKGPLPTEQVLKFGVEIADALDRAHRAGIVHRDLKPGNVMLTKSGVKLLDFGLAKAAASDAKPRGFPRFPPRRPLAPPDAQKGTVMGTFQYMAPEQLEGKEADPRSGHFRARLRAVRDGGREEGVHGREPRVPRLVDPERRAAAHLRDRPDGASRRSTGSSRPVSRKIPRTGGSPRAT